MTVGLGIIGVGRWADAHAEAASRSKQVDFVSCFGPTPERRASFAARHGIENVAESLGELLADRRVEAVVISSPNDVHAEHVRQVIAAGKLALVDKPLAVDAAEGIELLRLVKDWSVPVGVAHHARRLAGHRAAADWIASGAAGAIRVAHADFSNARGAHLAADAWHRTDRGSEAGVLIQVGIHHVDNLLYLLGPPVSVNARLAYGTPGLEIPDVAVVIVNHAGGAISAVSSCWTTPSHYRLDLLATGGNLEFRLDHSQWASPDVDDHSELTLETPTQRRRTVSIDKGDPLREQLEELGMAVRQGTPMEVGVAEGLRAVAVVEAAALSAGLGGEEVDIRGLLSTAGATANEIDGLMER
ncbi:MAG: Gfo/Idh/MocA family oxidoreductase [Acidimicrobiia bacterium]|nr:Gfo/Idh/MocA family oxidoreductase [Acidimicrobiia bacterium]